MVSHLPSQPRGRLSVGPVRLLVFVDALDKIMALPGCGVKGMGEPV